MKTKLNLYCTLLVLAVLFSFAVDSYFHFGDFFEGFQNGWEDGKADTGTNWEGTALEDVHPLLATFIAIIGGLCGLAFIILFFAFWCYFYRTIWTIKKGGIFDDSVPTGVRFMGYMLMLYFAVNTIYQITSGPITHVDYPTDYLCFGCGLLVVSDVLIRAKEIKEEQDLTI